MSTENRRFYWLKLKEDFFRDKKIKKLRKIAGGDTYTIIYLKMQLLSLKSNGVLVYEGVENTFEEEIALEIDEEIENVKVTIAFLIANNLLVNTDHDNYKLLTDVSKNTGSESTSAERVRNHREKQKALQCNTDVTTCNTNVKNGNVDIDIYIENKSIELDKENKNKEIDLDKEIKKLYNFNSTNKDILVAEQFRLWNDLFKEYDNPTVPNDIYNLFNFRNENLGLNLVINSMLNYYRVIKDSSYYFDHTWKLKEFLQKDNALPAFLPNGERWLQYSSKYKPQEIVPKADSPLKGLMESIK